VATTMSTGLTSSSCGTLCSTISLHTSNVMDSMIMTLSRMNGLKRWEWNQKNQQQRIPSRHCVLPSVAMRAACEAPDHRHVLRPTHFPICVVAKADHLTLPGSPPCLLSPWGLCTNEVMRHMCRGGAHQGFISSSPSPPWGDGVVVKTEISILTDRVHLLIRLYKKAPRIAGNPRIAGIPTRGVPLTPIRVFVTSCRFPYIKTSTDKIGDVSGARVLTSDGKRGFSAFCHRQEARREERTPLRPACPRCQVDLALVWGAVL